MKPDLSILMKELIKRTNTIIESVANDISFHGGLTSRETIRQCDETRIVLDRISKALK